MFWRAWKDKKVGRLLCSQHRRKSTIFLPITVLTSTIWSKSKLTFCLCYFRTDFSFWVGRIISLGLYSEFDKYSVYLILKISLFSFNILLIKYIFEKNALYWIMQTFSIEILNTTHQIHSYIKLNFFEWHKKKNTHKWKLQLGWNHDKTNLFWNGSTDEHTERSVPKAKLIYQINIL